MTRPQLLLGPMLRYVDERRATVWVEADAACDVVVRAGELSGSARTFTAHGHHYAIVVVSGLEPGSSTEYSVELEGHVVWPDADGDYPPSRIRTLERGRPFRLAFGSCRTSVPNDPKQQKTHGPDVLRAIAHRMSEEPETTWPDMVLFIGDQVYADEPSEEMHSFIAGRRDINVPPGEEIADFEEYTRAYRIAWSDEGCRWLFSSLPSAMMFDDHDVRDDWNTSQAWREEINRQPWWRSRIVGGLGSYWVYQHLGNLSPEELADDPLLAELCAHDGDAGEILDRFADFADREPKHNRWSYVRDVGATRLVVIDSRCGRVLEPDLRAIVDDDEWAWIDERLTGDRDHVLIGTSLPYLLPMGVHHVEGWNEAVAAGAWGRRSAKVAEGIRQQVDLEHWGAFRRSFEAMATSVRDLATGRRGTPPSSVIFLSGDVHYSFLAQAEVEPQAADGAASDAGSRSAVFQAVCSPIRNPLGRVGRIGNIVSQFALARIVGRGLARLAKVAPPSIDWTVEKGPLFSNALATVELVGRSASIRWDVAKVDADGVEQVEEAMTARLV